MKNKFKLLAACAAVAGAFAAPAFAEGVEFHGYLRTGVGGTTEGGNQQCFSGQFPIRTKFRLGNECDTYGEVQINAPFGNKDGAWGQYVLMQALQGGDQGDYTSINSDQYTMANRQNYVQFGGIFGKGAMQDSKLWIGKRYYNRHDVHINDYFYWNNSGQGAGIEDIDAGPTKLAFAYFQTGGNANKFSDIVSKRYSARFYGLGVNKNGTLEGDFVYLKDSTADSSKATGSGWKMMLEHTQGGFEEFLPGAGGVATMGGFNKLAFTYGKDQGNGFEWLPTYPATGPATGSAWSVTDQLYFEVKNTGWSGMFTTTYAKSDCCGGDQKWFNIGIRPQYNFSDIYSIATELGFDRGQTGDTAAKRITKLTVAPQVALTRGFWSRPVLRAFVTYADWNDANGDAGTNGVFGTKTAGTTFGLQVEAWW